MLLIQSNTNKNTGGIETFKVSKDYLKYVVENISIPRHYIYEKSNNDKIRDWIRKEFELIGLETTLQGRYDNIVASYKELKSLKSIIIVGGHYDSVPNSFGADDNASAIAGLLATAKALKNLDIKNDVIFVAFNREEDGLLGSKEFVKSLSNKLKKEIKAVHILEMIGFCSHKPKSQFIPKELPIKVGDIGNFIALIANKNSNHLINPIIKLSEDKIRNLPVIGLKIFWGIEKFFPNLSRSDHLPFWNEKIPTLMWTDTSEFRNPNYHKKSDKPATLDYDFMSKVIGLLILTLNL